MNNMNNLPNNISMCMSNLPPYMYTVQSMSMDAVQFARTTFRNDLSLTKLMEWGAVARKSVSNVYVLEKLVTVLKSRWCAPVVAALMGYRIGYLRGRVQAKDMKMIMWNLCSVMSDIKDQTSEMHDDVKDILTSSQNNQEVDDEVLGTWSILDCIDVCNKQLEENCKGQHPNTCKGYKRTLKALCECTNPHIAKNLPPMIWEYGTTNGENCEKIHTWVENMHLPPNFRPKKAACRSALLKAFPKKSLQ